MRWREAWMRAAATGRLMVGIPDYQAYLAHRRTSHPNEPVMTRAQFHRERTERRFGGVSRCC